MNQANPTKAPHKGVPKPAKAHRPRVGGGEERAGGSPPRPAPPLPFNPFGTDGAGPEDFLPYQLWMVA